MGALVLGPNGLSIGPISGAGAVVAGNETLVLGSAVSSNLQISLGTLELAAAAMGFMDTSATISQQNVLTSGMYGGQIATPTLALDNPANIADLIYGFAALPFIPARSFRGAAYPYFAVANDRIILQGISLSQTLNQTYRQTGAGGVLSVQAGTTTISLAFACQYQLADFAFDAGPQAYSSSPASLVITDKTYVVSDTAATLLAVQADGALLAASKVTLSGQANIVTASQAAILAAMPGFSLAPGTTMQVQDTATNLTANPAGLAFATSILPSDAGLTEAQINAGDPDGVAPGNNTVIDTATVRITISGGMTGGQLIIASAGGLAFNAGGGAVDPFG